MTQNILLNFPLNEFEVIQKQWIKEVLSENGQNGQPKKEEPELLTRIQTALILSVSLPTLNEWTKEGRVIGYRIGSRVRYKKNEVIDSLQKIKKYRRDTNE
jgi:excisionase family DNA binding protein